MDVSAPHRCLLLRQALNPSGSLHRKHFFLLKFHEYHPPLLFSGFSSPFNGRNSQSLEAVLGSTCAVWDHISFMPHRLSCRKIPYPQNWPTCIFLFGGDKLPSWDHILCSCIQREQWDLSRPAIGNLCTQLGKTCFCGIWLYFCDSLCSVSPVKCIPNTRVWLCLEFFLIREQGLSFFMTVDC